MMDLAPCGKLCKECEAFGRSCEGCSREMNLSFSYKCNRYSLLDNNKHQIWKMSYDRKIGEKILCPLLIIKSTEKVIDHSHVLDTPVQ